MNFSSVLNKIKSSSTGVGKIHEPVSQMNQTLAFLQILLICGLVFFPPKLPNLELVFLLAWGRDWGRAKVVGNVCATLIYIFICY